MNTILTYFMIGVVFTLLVDIASDYAKSKGIHVPPESEWNNQTRLMAIFIWPIGLIFFISGYLKAIINNNKNN